MEPRGFRDLLQAAQSGDEPAVERLLALIRDHLAQSAERFRDQRQAVESGSDLAQEAAIRLWQHINEFQGGDSDEESLAKFLAWTLQIVRRLGLNARRDHAAQRRSPQGQPLRLTTLSAADSITQGVPEPAAADPTPSAAARSSEEALVIRDAVSRLPDDLDRELLRLRFFEGCSMRQIAERVPISYDQIRDRFRAIMRKLERDLEGLL